MSKYVKNEFFNDFTQNCCKKNTIKLKNINFSRCKHQFLLIVYIGGVILKQDIIELKDIFNKIKKKGWIKSERTGSTGIGYTFEKHIMKKEENFPIPDYKSIEIKTMRYFSKRKIHLFNTTPDGDFLFPIKKILNTLGYPDKSNPEYKILYISINAKEYTNIGH